MLDSRSNSSSMITMIAGLILVSTMMPLTSGAYPVATNPVHDRMLKPVKTSRIVGGVRATEYLSYGYSAGSAQCGGTLIFGDILLSAARKYHVVPILASTRALLHPLSN
jgi:hypothetical protein